MLPTAPAADVDVWALSDPAPGPVTFVPCSAAHGRHCSPAHAAMVAAYRDARVVAEETRDDVTMAYATERAEYARDVGMLTFGRWLRSSRSA